MTAEVASSGPSSPQRRLECSGHDRTIPAPRADRGCSPYMQSPLAALPGANSHIKRYGDWASGWGMCAMSDLVIVIAVVVVVIAIVVLLLVVIVLILIRVVILVVLLVFVAIVIVGAVTTFALRTT